MGNQSKNQKLSQRQRLIQSHLHVWVCVGGQISPRRDPHAAPRRTENLAFGDTLPAAELSFHAPGVHVVVMQTVCMYWIVRIWRQIVVLCWKCDPTDVICDLLHQQWELLW